MEKVVRAAYSMIVGLAGAGWAGQPPHMSTVHLNQPAVLLSHINEPATIRTSQPNRLFIAWHCVALPSQNPKPASSQKHGSSEPASSTSLLHKRTSNDTNQPTE